jgi:dTDP-4-dehydrorhamnose reductase
VTIVLTGGGGILGRALIAALPQALAPTRNELDLLDERTGEAYLRGHPPSAIVHAAALTDVGRCEEDRELAWRVNVDGTSALLRVAREVAPDCYVLYVSTAGVFPGDAGNYAEESLPNPVNYYGVTKWKGEEEVLRHDRTCVVRTNFVRRGKWPHPHAFVDRYGTFLYDTGAAGGICDVLAARLTGIVHICGSVRLSLYELARKTDPEVKPMSLDGYHGPPLTRDMSLVTHRWKTYTLSD